MTDERNEQQRQQHEKEQQRSQSTVEIEHEATHSREIDKEETIEHFNGYGY